MKKAKDKLADLRERHAQAAAAHEEAKATLEAAVDLTSPYVDFTNKPEHSEADVLEARANQPELMKRFAAATREFDEVAAELKAAEKAEREATRAAAMDRMRPLVPKLDKKMAEVEKMLVDIAGHDATAQVGVLGGLELLIDGPQRTGLLPLWRAHLRSLGLLGY